MQSDSIGLEGGENSFVYVGDNPLSRVDKLGLYWSIAKLLAAYQSREEMNIPAKGGTLAYNFSIWSGNNANSCAVRLSNAFNRAGYSDVTYRAWKYTPYRTLGDKYGNRYLFRAKEMGKHLGLFKRKYRVYNIDDLRYKSGLIYFENYHVDLVYDYGAGPTLKGNGSVIEEYMQNHRTYFMEL